MAKPFHRNYSLFNKFYLKKYSSKIQHIWKFYLDGIYRTVEFWDSKISGKKKLAVDSKILALDDSGSDFFKCTFSIAPHILKITQKDEDRFYLTIDQYSFLALMAEERNGTLKQLQEKLNENENKNMNNPVDDVDKLLKKQLEKEKIEEKRKQEEKKVNRLKKELEEKKRKNDDDDMDFMSPSEINKIKNNLNNFLF